MGIFYGNNGYNGEWLLPYNPSLYLVQKGRAYIPYIIHSYPYISERETSGNYIVTQEKHLSL